MRIMLEGNAARQVAETAAGNGKVCDGFADLVAEFEVLGRQAPSPERRDRFYEPAEAHDQAVIAHARNDHPLERVDGITA
jgi:hypothetical protein